MSIFTKTASRISLSIATAGSSLFLAPALVAPASGTAVPYAGTEVGGGPVTRTLSAVSARTTDDVWAVGSIVRGGGERTLVKHWDGHSWTKVSSVDPDPSQSRLLGVAAIAEDEVWAVGSTGVMPTRRVLIGHWDGHRWSAVAAPGDVPLDSDLRAVAAVSSDDLWAVGRTTKIFGDAQVVLVHWDGSTWTRFPSQKAGWLHRELSGVVALSSSDVWAVGYGYQDEEAGDLPIALHWDGTTWRQQVLDYEDKYDDQPMNAIDATSPTDMWAVGSYGYGESKETAIEHRTTMEGQRVASPSVPKTVLHGVTAIASDDVWAVGAVDEPFDSYPLPTTHPPVPYILHWTGSAWAEAAPGRRGGATALYGVDGVATDDVWAVGTSGPGCPSVSALVEHWDGSTWSVT